MESLRDTLKFLIKPGDHRLRCGSFFSPLLLFKFNALKDVYFLWCDKCLYLDFSVAFALMFCVGNSML